MISEQSVLRLSFPSLWLQVGPIKIFPLYSTLPPQQQQKIFEPVSFPFLVGRTEACDKIKQSWHKSLAHFAYIMAKKRLMQNNILLISFITLCIALLLLLYHRVYVDCET